MSGNAVVNVIGSGVKVLKDVNDTLNSLLKQYQPLHVVLASICGTVTYIHIRRIIRRSDRPIAKRIRDSILSLAMLLPSVQEMVDKELDTTRAKLIEQIHGCDLSRIFVNVLPDNEMDDEKILSLIENYSSMGKGISEITSGHVSGAVYNDIDDEQLQKLQAEVFKKFSYSNPLHPMIFPDCRKMEAEVIRMVANMFNGDENVRGTVTSGGTESILLAMLAYRNRANNRGIMEPQILVPITAHAAFDKAVMMYDIRIRHIDVNADGRVDVKKMEKAITSETCVLVASAPNFPTGSIDDVAAISELGIKYGIPVHVDSCLGGFLVPFMADAGYPLPLFDFRLPGVTSISCDTHKYGYTPKGSSVILYRNVDYLHNQYTCVPEWTGGVYATPTLLGSRAGSTIALTWATMLHFGRQKYVSRTKEIIECTRRIADGIGATSQEGIKGVSLIGSSDVSVVAFRSDIVNTYAIGDGMSKLGWHLNALQNPPGQHICVTYNTVKSNSAETFLRDLQEVVDELANEPTKGNDSEMAVIYGMAESIPDKSVVNEVAYAYLDACYATPKVTER